LCCVDSTVVFEEWCDEKARRKARISPALGGGFGVDVGGGDIIHFRAIQYRGFPVCPANELLLSMMSTSSSQQPLASRFASDKSS
jgi:hypothetical protein